MPQIERRSRKIPLDPPKKDPEELHRDLFLFFFKLRTFHLIFDGDVVKLPGSFRAVSVQFLMRQNDSSVDSEQFQSSSELQSFNWR